MLYGLGLFGGIMWYIFNKFEFEEFLGNVKVEVFSIDYVGDLNYDMELILNFFISDMFVLCGVVI